MKYAYNYGVINNYVSWLCVDIYEYSGILEVYYAPADAPFFPPPRHFDADVIILTSRGIKISSKTVILEIHYTENWDSK